MCTRGSLRRSAASASRPRVASFSLTSSASRATCHSSAETTGGRFMRLLSPFPFYSLDGPPDENSSPAPLVPVLVEALLDIGAVSADFDDPSQRLERRLRAGSGRPRRRSRRADPLRGTAARRTPRPRETPPSLRLLPAPVRAPTRSPP